MAKTKNRHKCIKLMYKQHTGERPTYYGSPNENSTLNGFKPWSDTTWRLNHGQKVIKSVGRGRTW